jgi:uncharacterized protein YhbP (UPF0306 family)
MSGAAKGAPAGGAAKGAPVVGAGPGAGLQGAEDLRARVERYLRAHHTMTIATVGPPAGAAPQSGGAPAAAAAPPAHAPDGAPAPPLAPHAASVFYAVDDSLRLVFLSDATSTHGLHIGVAAPVAVTVTEQYDDWELIQGVQLWGTAKRITGAAKIAAMAAYVRRFPFVKDVMDQPRLAQAMARVAVYRVTPERVAFTDNTTGVFGREVLDLKG